MKDISISAGQNAEPNAYSTIDDIVGVYHAFDSIVQDNKEIEKLRAELLRDCEDAEAEKWVHGQISDMAKTLGLQERYAYAADSVSKKLDVMRIGKAILAFAGDFEQEEEKRAAEKRAQRFGKALIQHAWGRYGLNYRSLIADVIPLQSSDASADPAMIVHYRVDKEGKKWVSPCDPRAVQMPVKTGARERVVTTYTPQTTTIDSVTGEMVVDLGNRKITITAGDDTYRMGKNGKLELFIPADRTSVDSYEGELTYDEIARLMGQEDGATVVIAAGANIPNIIHSFEYPDGVNPHPLLVPKAN
jgi:hypothetical protein